MKYSESASFSFFYIYLKKTNEIKCEATGCFFLVYFFFPYKSGQYRILEIDYLFWFSSF